MEWSEESQQVSAASAQPNATRSCPPNSSAAISAATRTSPSAPASTPASGSTSRGWRAGSRSRACSRALLAAALRRRASEGTTGDRQRTMQYRGEVQKDSGMHSRFRHHATSGSPRMRSGSTHALFRDAGGRSDWQLPGEACIALILRAGAVAIPANHHCQCRLGRRRLHQRDDRSGRARGAGMSGESRDDLRMQLAATGGATGRRT
jgi:hypothetical protein